MNGLTIQDLKVALAAQLVANVSRQVTVRPYRTPPATRPCITMDITDITYYQTMGAYGLAQLDLNLTLWIATGDKDSDDVAMSDYLSGGTANRSSIFDAINIDVTLGGAVDSCTCLLVRPPVDIGDDYQAVFPVSILCKKVGGR